jgi:hypothetical protein
MSEDIAIAQIVTAITSVFYAAVFVIGYYLIIKGNRETLREMREQRISGGRPQVLIQARYDRLPMVDLVVRNFGAGAAKDITFAFSDSLEDSRGFVLSELPYFQEGTSFLGPGDEIVCAWDNLENLASSLREQGHNSGISVKVRYEDLAGDRVADQPPDLQTQSTRSSSELSSCRGFSVRSDTSFRESAEGKRRRTFS